MDEHDRHDTHPFRSPTLPKFTGKDIEESYNWQPKHFMPPYSF